ncbi:MAG: DUF1015 family protein [Bacteroidia bacterium]|nr:DUF1015 family protein [Bacteroidia bacterium]
MALILPFKAFRPVHDKVFHVVCRSADGFTSSTIKKIIESNPYSFLNIIFPDFSEKNKSKAGTPERMRKIRHAFEQSKEKKLFISDEEPAYYIYRQIKKNIEYTGIVGVIHADEYRNGHVKIHEHTLTEREEKLMQYLDLVEWNAEPVLFFYKSNTELQQLVYDITDKQFPLYDFSGTDEIRHIVWKTEKKSMVQKIRSAFEKVENVYIADGHHRSSSSVLLADKRLGEGVDNHHPSQYYMGIFFDSKELKVYEFNRLLDNRFMITPDVMLQKAEADFNITKIEKPTGPPSEKTEFFVFTKGQWYSLKLKNTADALLKMPSAGIWNEYFLKRIYGVDDPKNEKKIHYLPGTLGIEVVEKEVLNGNYGVGCILSPSTTKEIRDIADRGDVMPPKSTWIEPKLLNGLLIYDFSRHHDPL